jgi:hypothetical protein
VADRLGYVTLVRGEAGPPSTNAQDEFSAPLAQEERMKTRLDAIASSGLAQCRMDLLLALVLAGNELFASLAWIVVGLFME